nr:GAF domain-containing protein [Microbulbifer elongatus]
MAPVQRCALASPKGKAVPAQFSIYYPRRPVKEVRLEDNRVYRLGRGTDCNLQLDNPSVSRLHAELKQVEGVWTLRDLASKNGTKLHGSNIRVAQLTDDCWLSVGELQARFQLLGEHQLERIHGQNTRRWQHCEEIGKRLSDSSDLEQMLARVLEGVVQLAGTDRAFILLKDNTDNLSISAMHGVTPEALQCADFAGSRSAVAEVLKSGRPLVTSDSLDHQFLSSQPSIQLNAIRALACLPLVMDDKQLGVIYTDSLLLGKGITELDLSILEAMADNASMAIAATLLKADLDQLNRCTADTQIPSLSAW